MGEAQPLEAVPKPEARYRATQTAAATKWGTTRTTVAAAAVAGLQRASTAGSGTSRKASYHQPLMNSVS